MHQALAPKTEQFDVLAAAPPTVSAPAHEQAILEGVDRPAVAIRHRRYRRLLALGDIVGFGLALVAMVTLVSGASLAWPAVALPLLIPLAAKIGGLYHHDQALIAKTSLGEAPRLFQLSMLYVLAASFGQEVLLDGLLTRTQALVLLVAAVALPLAARRAGRAAARACTVPERCLFIGSEQAAPRVRAKLAQQGHAVLVEHLSIPAARAASDGQGNGTVALRELVERADVHRIVIESDHAQDAAYDLIRTSKQLGVRVSLLPGVFEIVGTAVEIDELSGMVLLGLRPFGLSRSSILLKRAFDVTGATLGLVAMAPVLAAIAIAIRIDSPGQVLFRQTRVGRGGSWFQILKFRTMEVGAEHRRAEFAHRNEADGLFKITDDPRVTRVGRFLRRTSLDELPQLLNVLFGEMSLVGPRPLVLDEDAKITGWDRRRLMLTPGMTGPWQIAGSARIPLAEMVKIDYRYVGCWSLWSDCKILARTVLYAAGRRGL